MVIWLFCVWAHGESEHHGRKDVTEQNCSLHDIQEADEKYNKPPKSHAQQTVEFLSFSNSPIICLPHFQYTKSYWDPRLNL